MVVRGSKLGRITKLRVVTINGKSTKVVMEISQQTFERLRENSSRYGDRENYDEIIIRLVDFYECEKEKCFIYPSK